MKKNPLSENVRPSKAFFTLELQSGQIDFRCPYKCFESGRDSIVGPPRGPAPFSQPYSGGARLLLLCASRLVRDRLSPGALQAQGAALGILLALQV